MSTIEEKLTLANDNVPKVYAAGGAGTDLSNYVKKTDYATATTAGVVKVPVDSGIELESDGDICITAASEEEILARNETCRPIVPATLNNAVKAALSDDNRIDDMTYEEKFYARGIIGAASDDTATWGNVGLVTVENANTGLYIYNYGNLRIAPATTYDIDDRISEYNPIVPNTLDYAVRSVKPKISNSLPNPLAVNTIYDASTTGGSITAGIFIKLPAAQYGDFIQVDAYSGASPLMLTIESVSGITGFDLIPEANTMYSLYFDYGVIYNDFNTETQTIDRVLGWRFGYAAYPYEEV